MQRLAAALQKEVPQHLRGFIGQYTPSQRDAMVVAFRLQQVKHTDSSTRFWVIGRIHDACNSRMHECHGAHRAGLQRDIQRTAR